MFWYVSTDLHDIQTLMIRICSFVHRVASCFRLSCDQYCTDRLDPHFFQFLVWAGILHCQSLIYMYTCFCINCCFLALSNTDSIFPNAVDPHSRRGSHLLTSLALVTLVSHFWLTSQRNHWCGNSLNFNFENSRQDVDFGPLTQYYTVPATFGKSSQQRFCE